MWGGAKDTFQLHWPAFIVAFAVGMLYVYVTTPAPRIVFKHPTPFNAGKITYRDDAETCFQYVATQVECPKDKSKVVAQPLI